jgi:hypothetical protein
VKQPIPEPLAQEMVVIAEFAATETEKRIAAIHEVPDL